MGSDDGCGGGFVSGIWFIFVISVGFVINEEVKGIGCPLLYLLQNSL